jgi:uncharacterized protein (TIGR02001 family)
MVTNLKRSFVGVSDERLSQDAHKWLTGNQGVHLWRSSVVWLMAVLAPNAHGSDMDLQWGGLASLTSDYVSRGVSLSHGQNAWQADLHLDLDAQWRVGVWASKLSLVPDRSSTELDFYLGKAWGLSTELALLTSLTRYTYVNDPRMVSYTYHEVGVSLNWRDAWTVSVNWSPDVALIAPPSMGILQHEQTLAVETGYHLALPLDLEWQIGAGYFAALERHYGDYVYGSTLLARRFGSLQAEVAWYATQNQQHRLYSPSLPGGPWAFNVTYSFGSSR